MLGSGAELYPCTRLYHISEQLQAGTRAASLIVHYLIIGIHCIVGAGSGISGLLLIPLI